MIPKTEKAMAQKNSEYWEKRIADKTTWRLYNTLEEKNRALLEMYQDATREINSAIYELGEKLSKNGQIKRSELYKYNHLKNLQAKMNSILKTLGGTIEDFAAGNMENAFKENYGDILKSLGKKGFDLPNKKLMEALLKKPWFGGNFSDRLWGNTEKLAQILNSELRQGLQQGKTTTEVAAKIAALMQSSFNSAHRLVRTETMHYLNQSSLEAYKAGGVQFVQFWAAMDERTCPSCGALHGKIYAIDKVPVLPLHAHCRCTYLPVTDSKQLTDYFKTLDLPSVYFDTDKANPETVMKLFVNFDKWAATDNNPYRQLLKQHADQTAFHIRDDEGLIFLYDGKADTILLNPAHKHFERYDFIEAITHEMAHRIDYNNVHSWDNGSFGDAIQKSTLSVRGQIKDLQEALDSNQSLAENMMLSDILSAMAGERLRLYSGHSEAYWGIAGNREAEIFADLFTLFSKNDKEAIDFLTKYLYDIVNVFRKLV